MLCVAAMREPQHRRIRVAESIEIAIQDFGGDGPLVLLHHAVGFCADTWRETVRLLPEDVHVVALDARGHGQSSKPPDPAAYSWANIAADLGAVGEALVSRFGQPAIALAVGHSFGGTCTLGAAARAPGLFARVLALDPVLIRRPDPASSAAPAARGRNPGERSRYRRAVFASFEAALAAFRSKPLFQSWQPAVLRDYVQHGLAARDDGQVELCCPPEIELAVFQGGRGLDVFGVASQITAKTWIYWAEHGNFSLDAYRTLAARMPSATVGTVAAGHLIPMERPDWTAELIAGLLAEPAG
jgi:pimeloyl-ACP methyl ester carboxylesterase